MDASKKYVEHNGVFFEYSNESKGFVVTGPAERKPVNIVIPEKVNDVPVVRVRYDAFARYDTLQNIVLSSGIKSIGTCAFHSCSALESVTFPDTLKEIYDFAFVHCTSLQRINIPKNVSKIELRAFLDCKGLKYIDVDKDNETFCSVDGVLFNKDMTVLLKYPEDRPGVEYKIPDTVTHIGGYAFRGSNSLQNIIIPDSVTHIGSAAFSECKKICKIVIPETVKNIEWKAFDLCTGLKSIELNSDAKISDYSFVDCRSLQSVFVDKDILNSTKRSFNCIYGLKTVLIGDNVKNIRRGTFAGCKELETYIVSKDNKYLASDNQGVVYTKNRDAIVVLPARNAGTLFLPNTLTKLDAKTIGDIAKRYNTVVIGDDNKLNQSTIDRLHKKMYEAKKTVRREKSYQIEL